MRGATPATARKGLRVHAHLEECHFLARAHTVYARTLSLYPDTAGVRSLSCVAAGYTAGQYDRCAERVFERQVVARLSCAQLRLIVCVCVCVCVRACLSARARSHNGVRLQGPPVEWKASRRHHGKKTRVCQLGTDVLRYAEKRSQSLDKTVSDAP